MSNKEIKILLIRKDVKQADIARKLKVSKTAVHNVIKGISESARIKRAIAEVLGVKVEDLWNNHKAA
jgi:DNA-binding XRE family transcriptional regulator